MAGLLVRIKSRMFIHAHRKALHLLDGEYGSLVTGRSMDFEDLRGYVAGDEVRDIDWKATARHGSTLVRRYTALRRQTVFFVVDTGRNMAARADDGEVKSEVALTVVGVLGYLAVRHGDEVSLLSGDSTRTIRTPARTGESHLERLLQSIDRAHSLDAPASDLERTLRLVTRTVRRRAVVVVVADDAALGDEEKKLIRRLRAQHELVWITIGDIDPLRLAGAAAVDDGWTIPEALREDRRLTEELARTIRDDVASREADFDDLGVSYRRIGRVVDVVPGLLHLLRARSHA
jgi:uncharacterized protein (DUF58 family)